MTTNAREVTPPVVGVSDAASALLDGLVVNPSELSQLSLDNCDVTIVGFDFDKGGETRQNPRDHTDFITRPQITMGLRVDDMEGFDATRQFFGVRLGNDGRIAAPQNTSAYGLFLNTLSGLGISGDPDMASEYLLKSARDLLGLRYHRQLQQFDAYRGSTVDVHVPTIIYGFDNEVRAKNGLEPASIASEVAAA